MVINLDLNSRFYLNGTTRDWYCKKTPIIIFLQLLYFHWLTVHHGVDSFQLGGKWPTASYWFDSGGTIIINHRTNAWGGFIGLKKKFKSFFKNSTRLSNSQRCLLAPMLQLHSDLKTIKYISG